MLEMASGHGTNPNASGSREAEGDETVFMETRFGSVEIRPASELTFPAGLPGFQQRRRFALCELPKESMQAFRLLQCLDDPEVGFIVVPMAGTEGLIDQEDLAEACGVVGTPPEKTAFLLIVTIRPGPQGPRITANLRAPVVVNLERRSARQVVLSNGRYDIQHPLG